MSPESGFTALLNNLVSLPILVVLIAGLGIAVRHQPRYPRASLLAAGALTVALIQFALGIGLQVWLNRVNAGGGYSQVGAYLSLFGVVRMLLEVLIWVLVLMAVFIDRSPATPGTPERP